MTRFQNIVSSRRSVLRFLMWFLTIDIPARTCTSWLDGYRGYASFVVSIGHFRVGWTDTIDMGWGTRKSDRSLLQLPGIRLLFAGPAMVAAFYYLSGYSLSWGAFKDLQAGDQEKCLRRIRSSAFRRYIRLYLPVVWCSFIVLCCICLGLYDKGVEVDSRWHVTDPIPTIYPTVWEQVQDWMIYTWEFLNVWTLPRHRYYVHSWSVPVEFESSMLLYLVLIAIAAMRFRARVLILCIVTAYCHATGKQYTWTFLLGSLTAQITSRIIHAKGWQGGFPTANRGWKSNAAWITIFTWGVYCASFPSGHWDEAPFYGLLRMYIPYHWPIPAWFWHGVGAASISLAASQNLIIQNILSNRVARYFGRISYALYLVHGIVIRTVSLRLAPWVGFSKKTKPKAYDGVQFDIEMLLVFLVQEPVCFIAAMAFTKLFDDTSIRLSKYWEKKLIGEDTSQGYAVLPMRETQDPMDSNGKEEVSPRQAEMDTTARHGAPRVMEKETAALESSIQLLEIEPTTGESSHGSRRSGSLRGDRLLSDYKNTRL